MNKIVLIILALIILTGVFGLVYLKFGKNIAEKTLNQSEESNSAPQSALSVNNTPRNRVVNAPVSYDDKGFEVDSMIISKGQPFVVVNNSKSVLTLVISTTPITNILIMPGKTGVTAPFGDIGTYEVKDLNKNTFQLTVKE